jgi:hypothetical protein
MPGSDRANELSMTITSTGLVTIPFGFVAGSIRLKNDGPGSIFPSLKGPATTTLAPLTSGETLVIGDPRPMYLTATISIAATSTATNARLQAWG